MPRLRRPGSALRQDGLHVLYEPFSVYKHDEGGMNIDVQESGG